MNKEWKPGESSMLYLDGSKQSWHCDYPVGLLKQHKCGCNVFTKHEEEGKFICNSCESVYKSC
jgi:hypothetical protein